jgi:hypothetical protein
MGASLAEPSHHNAGNLKCNRSALAAYDAKGSQGCISTTGKGVSLAGGIS